MNDYTFRSDVTVELVKHNLSDEDVARAARVSTVGGDSLDSDKPIEGLINYLMRDRHGSPFEHGSATFYIEAPLFVAREHFRHRAGWSYNEESGRYKELGPTFYVPGRHRKLVQIGKAGAYRFKKGSAFQHFVTQKAMKLIYKWSYRAYRLMLRVGVAREVARMVLPVGIFTSYYATCNARSLMHFLSLRTIDENSKFPSFPQYEIELVADRMEMALAELMPLTMAAFDKLGRVAP